MIYRIGLRSSKVWVNYPIITPLLRMFQSWFVVSDLQCFCPPCSNRRAFAFGKRQPRGGLLRYRYRKGPLDLTFTPQYPQHRQQQTQCNQPIRLDFQPSLPPLQRCGTFSISRAQTSLLVCRGEKTTVVKKPTFSIIDYNCNW